MKLSKILIEAGVTPSDLHPDSYILTIELNNIYVIEYTRICGRVCKLYQDKFTPNDWQTPLSREQLIADYEAHYAVTNN